MIPEFLKIRIEMRFGKSIRYSKDCETLAASISKHCGEKISATTMMRLFGLMKTDSKPRLYTLDLVAQFAGFDSWEAAIKDDYLSEQSSIDQINSLIISSLAIQQKIHITYSPDRMLKLAYLGSMDFEVKEVQNSKLQVGDIIKVLRLECSFPFVCENVTRQGKDLGKYVGGKEGGVMDISME
jgi:hypothetical protein